MYMHIAIVVAIAIGLFCAAAIVLAFWGKKKLNNYYQLQYTLVTKQLQEAENKTYSATGHSYTLQLKPAPVLWFWLIPKTFFVICFMPFIVMFIGLIPSISLHDIRSTDLPVVLGGALLIVLGVIYVCLWLGKVLWLITGKEVITLTNSTLIRQCYIAGIPLKKEYELSKISGLTIAIMEDSNTSLFFQGNYRGFSVYYKNPVLLYFNYKGSKKSIGNYCNYFNAVELRENIKRI